MFSGLLHSADSSGWPRDVVAEGPTAETPDTIQATGMLRTQGLIVLS